LRPLAPGGGDLGGGNITCQEETLQRKKQTEVQVGKAAGLKKSKPIYFGEGRSFLGGMGGKKRGDRGGT